MIFEKLLIREKERGSIILIASREMDQREKLYTKILFMKMGMILKEQDIDSDAGYLEMKKVYDNVGKEDFD